MLTIGLIAAMPQESGALLRLIQTTQPLTPKSLHGKTFELSGQPCLLVTSGMGLRRPALLLQSRRLMHNTRLAADNAALALLAALSHLTA